MYLPSSGGGQPEALAALAGQTRGAGSFDLRDAPRPAPEQQRIHRVRDPLLIASSRRANGRLKRAFDIAATLIGLVFLSPVLVTIAVLIVLEGGGPVLFGHARVGRRGAIFSCWKFRTMVRDADAALNHVLATDPVAARLWRETQKLENDPRITRIGAFLRATSLDELPQLFNVLRGEMSLVGPRPVTKRELDERYARDRRYYLLIRPGLTGLWQVSGRSRVSYRRRIELDQEYVRNWSFSRDLQILMRTVTVVMNREGAV